MKMCALSEGSQLIYLFKDLYKFVLVPVQNQ